MRLVLVAQDFPPSRGGIQTYCWELARRWARRSDDFVVIAPKQTGAESFDAAGKVSIRRVPGTGDTFFAAAARELARLPAETMSFHSQWPSAGAAQLLRAAGRTGKVFVAAHGRELLLRPWQASRVAQGAYDAARAKALVNADGVFPVSRYTAALVRDIGVEMPHVHVEPNGTDPDVFSPGDGSRMRQEFVLGDHMLFLSVARLVKRKGVGRALQAFHEVVKQGAKARFVVVGEGPELPRLRALASQLGVADRVLFAGGVSFENLIDWYRAADVFVLPATSDPPDVEGFGIVYLEASSTGLPVIGPNQGGPVDAIVDGVTGFTVDPEDVQALARVMGQLAADPKLRKRMGRAGRERVVDSANWDRVAERLWVTLQILGSKAPRVELQSN